MSALVDLHPDADVLTLDVEQDGPESVSVVLRQVVDGDELDRLELGFSRSPGWYVDDEADFAHVDRFEVLESGRCPDCGEDLSIDRCDGGLGRCSECVKMWRLPEGST